jgi:hypothetical protein
MEVRLELLDPELLDPELLDPELLDLQVLTLLQLIIILQVQVAWAVDTQELLNHIPLTTMRKKKRNTNT